MKRLILLLTLVCGVLVSVNAQIMRTEELEAYAVKQYGEKWVDAAARLADELTLDKNNGLTFVNVVDAPGKTAEQLYVILNYWFTASFNDANDVIKLNDKDAGTIIAQGYMSGIAAHSGGSNSYVVDIKPIIKCDIKDDKIRVTYTLPYYIVKTSVGGGIMNSISKGLTGKSTQVSVTEENLPLDKSYPFAEKDSHKKTSSKALIMSYAYSNVILDKIETAVTEGLVGNETDDW